MRPDTFSEISHPARYAAAETGNRRAEHSPSSVMNRLLLLLVLLTAALPLRAYPPAPAFTVYGTVRDAFGWELSASEAEIIFRETATNRVIGRGPVLMGAALTENYRVLLPLDHGRSGAPYRAEAVTALAAFKIEVVVDGITWFPVQMRAAPVTSLTSAEFTEVDLSLSEDADGDLLPDLWEQWQLEAAGMNPSQIFLITRDGDLDGDGMTNYDEYIAGTFALLTEDSLRLEFTGIAADNWSEMQFLAVIGKTYFLERSRDLVLWQRAPITLGNARTPIILDWQAPDTVLQQISTPPDGSGRWFYRLTVR